MNDNKENPPISLTETNPPRDLADVNNKNDSESPFSESILGTSDSLQGITTNHRSYRIGAGMTQLTFRGTPSSSMLFHPNLINLSI